MIGIICAVVFSAFLVAGPLPPKREKGDFIVCSLKPFVKIVIIYTDTLKTMQSFADGEGTVKFLDITVGTIKIVEGASLDVQEEEFDLRSRDWKHLCYPRVNPEGT